MEGEHAQMWQTPCKMTNSSSKPLQTLGKWYQPRNPKKIPKPAQKKILKLFHTHIETTGIRLDNGIRQLCCSHGRLTMLVIVFRWYLDLPAGLASIMMRN